MTGWRARSVIDSHRRRQPVRVTPSMPMAKDQLTLGFKALFALL